MVVINFFGALGRMLCDVPNDEAKNWVTLCWRGSLLFQSLSFVSPQFLDLLIGRRGECIFVIDKDIVLIPSSSNIRVAWVSSKFHTSPTSCKSFTFSPMMLSSIEHQKTNCTRLIKFDPTLLSFLLLKDVVLLVVANNFSFRNLVLGARRELS